MTRAELTRRIREKMAALPEFYTAGRLARYESIYGDALAAVRAGAVFVELEGLRGRLNETEDIVEITTGAQHWIVRLPKPGA